MMREVLPTLSREEAEKVENHLFRIYDINNDGVVDFHEFMTVFMILTGRTRGFMKLILDLKSQLLASTDRQCPHLLQYFDSFTMNTTAKRILANCYTSFHPPPF